MMLQGVLLVLVFAVPLCLALLCALVPGLREKKVRTGFVAASLTVCFTLAVLLCLQGDCELTLFTIAGDLPIMMASDALSRFFALLMSGMWLVVGIYSFRYMAHEGAENRFYTFYLLSEFALMGLCFSGTLVTMYLFFEMLTLLSVALVLHSLSKEAIAGGIKYLIYSIAGAMMGLLGIFFFSANTATQRFVAGGSLLPEAAGSAALLAVLFVSVIGFGTKAGMFPMHGWLPTAHPIAPAPASAVLSGVITKAGVLCIIRLIYYVVGADFVRGTWVQNMLLTLSLITVFMGSMMALLTDGLKKRLAYSSVSQISYVLFGVFCLQTTALQGALLHVWFHSIMKDALFMCAGAIIIRTGCKEVSELRGMGKRMPVTMWVFTIAGVCMVGVPPMCGFYSKWLLAQGSLAAGTAAFGWLGPVVLLVSALLTAGYLISVSIQAFFPCRKEAGESLAQQRCEVPKDMLVPMLILAVLMVVLGMFPQLLQGPASVIAQGLL